MTFLPVVERELRAASRRRATRWMRFLIAAGTVLVVLIGVGTASQYVRPAELAQTLFVSLGIVGLVFSLFAGIFLTADCLSVEKREGTLGLLFLTDLKGYDVVLGKLAATSCNALYGLLALVPAMALPLLMGGVTGAEVARVALTLVTTLMLSLAVGMFISALGRDTRHTLVGSIGAMLFLVAGLPCLYWVRYMAFGSERGGEWILLLNPVYTFFKAHEANMRSGPGATYFWVSVGLLAGLAVTLLWLASALLPRLWQDGGRTARQGSRELSSSGVNCAIEMRRARSGPVMQANPFAWVALRERGGVLQARWLFVVALVIWGGFFLGCFSEGRRNMREEALVGLFLTTYVVHVLFKCLVAVEASRRLSQDRQSGVLELLLVTPLPVMQILRGLLAGLLTAFVWPLVGVAAMNVALIWLLVAVDPVRMSSGAPKPEFIGCLLGGIVLLGTDVFAIVWSSLRLALSKRRHHLAVLGTLLRVLVPPWLLLGFFMLLVVAGRGLSREGGDGLIVMWFMMGFGTDMVVGLKAQAEVQAQFRRLAAGERVGVADSGGAALEGVPPRLADGQPVEGSLDSRR